MVTPRFLPEMGGVETHVRETARRLAGLGQQVSVVSADVVGSLPAAEVIDGVSVRRVQAYPRGGELRLAPRLTAAIREERPDVVHVQCYHTLVAPHAMLAAARHDLPYVVTFHAGGHSSGLRNLIRPVQQRALRPLLARAARLIALADFEVELYGRRLRLARERFVKVPNGADLPMLSDDERPVEDRNLILSVGRLERYKGHHRAIAALPHVLAKLPAARLRILGVGPYSSELERLARRLGVESRVEIATVPPTDRVAMARTLASARLVVLLSDYETHPVAAIEAAALGRRVLVSDNSGMAEFAATGAARTIPTRAGPEPTAQAMVQLMAEGPREIRFDLPTWDDCATRLLSVYRDVAGRRR